MISSVTFGKNSVNKSSRVLRGAIVLAAAMTLLPILAAAQTLIPLVNQPPDGAQLTFQLTDGTVMAQGFGASDWWQLTPDINGSYVNGTWTQLASLQPGYVPDDFASAVLADGRLIIEGGEYNLANFALTNQGSIYDPLANSWTPVAPPATWVAIGDSPSLVLPNGHFLLGQKVTKRLAELDPATLKWTELADTGKSDFNAEEGWTLLPDGTVLTADVKNAPNSEIYNPALQEWHSAGSTIVLLASPHEIDTGCLYYGGTATSGGLCYYPPGEIGPQILRPDGTVLVTGSYTTGEFIGFGPGNTSVYDTFSKTWTPGPVFPNGDYADDTFAVLLPSGDVLVEGVTTISYVFDGTTLAPGPPIPGCLMMLPNGEVFVGGGGTATEVYIPLGTYQTSWQPTISTYPTSVTRGSTYSITGTQFNGLSQAAAFGDELQTATNYPLVRITNNSTNHVFYARTHDHSTMGVATGSMPVSTHFDVPLTMETGASMLEVVANGIPSAAVAVTVN